MSTIQQKEEHTVITGHNGNALVDPYELKEAVDNKFLTQEEARLIFWSQFYVLQQQQQTTPPAIDD